ncbi:NAD-dependent epimerase/dehydratase family protein [Streptomyces boncukensis]|uniref:NAD-dependent epimerase/dehydratase family protein n=1 Tax=Streptomyces boncukensis TaxID=2711219 RepID=A0A6G4WQV1_9ACTN|nr:NAD-dependent epimerase/dehydratase family protein [Streptomyces boncukensis]NGO66871.1 NAD-dependent epimerase/dehydratase family protein [Streptomyces boncukensis]
MSQGLDVTVIGATGDLGKPLLRRLEADPQVGRIRAVGRSAFDPRAAGLASVEFVRADVVDAASVARAVRGADVVLHLAFLIFGPRAQTRAINIAGCRNVFRAAVAAGVRRLVYASSAAVYGFYDDRPLPLTEELPLRANRNYFYTQEKVATERILADVTAGTTVDAYVFRPCVIAGAESLALVRDNPLTRMGAKAPAGLMRALRRTGMKPVAFDAGVPMQLVHAEDVSEALALAVAGAGAPGAYNLAAPEELAVGDVARALGWPVARIPLGVARGLRALAAATPWTPPELQFYSHLLSAPMTVSCDKALRELGWKPRHRAGSVLAETVASARRQGLPAAGP